VKPNTKRKKNKYIWIEFFRPMSVEDIILPKAYMKTFRKFVEEKEIPNLMLYSSSPGVGKTTLAKALCNDIGADYLYINVSSESGIDTLRTSISRFASTKSFNGKPKIVIMDEFDGASNNLQMGLRAAIEEFHKVCRFIFTCNYITQIKDPVLSRCQVFDMNFTDKKIKDEMVPKVTNRVCKILDFKKVDYDNSVIVKLVEDHYPDIRKTIQICQQYSAVNGVIDSNIFNYEKVDEEFYTYLLNKDFRNARKYLIESNYNYEEMFTNLYHHFVPMLTKEVQPEAIITIAEYMYKNSHSIDKEINFAALMLELMGLIQ